MEKQKVIIVLLFTLLVNLCQSQYNWYQLYSGVSGNLWSVYFVNGNTGFVSGDIGNYILKTTNAGTNWIQKPIPSSILYVSFGDIYSGYATGNGGAIIKTTNSGDNWFNLSSPTSQNLLAPFILNNLTGWILGSYVLFSTTNGGINWITLTAPSSNQFGIYFLNTSTGYLSGSEGTFKTTNGGLNWILSLSSSEKTCVFFPSITTGYSAQADFFKTTNAGVNWYSVYTFAGQARSMYFIDNNIGYASTHNGHVYFTSNGGTNWVDTILTGSLWSINYSGSSMYSVGNSGMIFKKDLLHAYLNNIYKPNIGRIAFEQITLYDSLCSLHDSTFWYINDSLVSSQHSMTYIYPQGTTKIKLKISLNNGAKDSVTATVTRCIWKRYTSGQILAGLSLIGDSVLYAVSTGDAVYRMDINGNFIYPLVVGGSVLSSCSIANDTSVFITSTDANLYGFKSDGSNLWAPIPLGGQASTTPTVDSISNRLYVGISNGFFRAINRLAGTSAWSYFCNAPVRSSAVVSYDRKLVVASSVGTIYGFNLNNPTPVPPNWQLNLADSILVSPAIDAQGYFYFGSRSGKVYKISLTGTTNAGIVWQTPLTSAVTSSPTIDANGNIYVGTADGKFYSLNKNGGIRWFFQTPAQIKSTAAITTYQRVYFGNDAGEIYGLDTNKIVKFYYIDSAKISCAMLHHKGTLYFGNEAGRLFALYDSTGGSKGPVKPIWGTFQNNVRRTGEQLGTVSNYNHSSENIPDKFELFQNYPNPFNSMTNVQWTMSKSSNVKIVIYDVLGREVVTLVNEKLGPGKYSADFDGTNYASGVYFYKIVAGDFSEIKKMVLLK